MLVFNAAAEIHDYFKSKSVQLGLVPTMGALHSGHLSLVQRACSENEKVVVSIYVNPTQFNRATDLSLYPSNFKKDKELLKPFGDQVIIYVPEDKEIYPEGTESKIFDFGTLTTYMEGEFRPEHFNGVATVVETLFKTLKPSKAYFGEKDFQQLQVIKALNIQKNLGVVIVDCPVVREVNGLAMSSRNQNLTPDQREQASVIYKTLKELKNKGLHGNMAEMKAHFVKQVERYDSFKVEYFLIASPEDLIPVNEINPESSYRFFVAVFVGKTRLIDTLQFDRI